MASKRSFLSFSASFTGLIETACILALAGTWLGSLGSLHWLLDLFSHFRLQYLVLCLLVLVFAIGRRRKFLGLLALVSMFWNAWPVFEVHRTAEPGEGKLTLMTFNVLYNHPQPERVIEHVMKTDPDVVCLLETDWRWHEHLQPLRDKYPHHAEELEYGAFGFACFTRLPTKSLTTRYFAHGLFPSLVMELEHDGKPLTVIATHPPPPMSSHTAGIWQKQFIEIAKLASTIPHDLIVAGDLNATPWCHGMRLLQTGSGLQFRSADPVWPPTWGLHLPMMIPIDHVLVKGELSIMQRTIGPDLGSDHRPVLVRLLRLVDRP
ncbi:MAG: endonuclease/exonuclease/phosphatase family protein [Verrucomicrobiaceae bacterium]|nr:endonuclease/exonuclease/phosphatase family protein [Verrucomicrobiaceae bacterium]